MPRLDRLAPTQRNTILTRPVEVNYGSPWTLPGKPVADSTLAVVTTAGLHLRDDEPRNDPRYRVIPSDMEDADPLQSHSSIGFDRSLRMRDLNVGYAADHEWAGLGHDGLVTTGITDFA